MIRITEQTPEQGQARRRGWVWSLVQVFLIAGACGYLYAAVLPPLVADWVNDPVYSHGFLIPVLSLYFLWERRDALARLPARPSLGGLVGVLGGIALLMLGELGAEFFLMRVSMIVVIAGLVCYHGGWQYLQTLAFPIALLLFMIPWPAIILNMITLPLQNSWRHACPPRRYTCSTCRCTAKGTSFFFRIPPWKSWRPAVAFALLCPCSRWRWYSCT